MLLTYVAAEQSSMSQHVGGIELCFISGLGTREAVPWPTEKQLLIKALLQNTTEFLIMAIYTSA